MLTLFCKADIFHPDKNPYKLCIRVVLHFMDILFIVNKYLHEILGFHLLASFINLHRTRFPRYLALGFYLGNTNFWYENLVHIRSPWARYWVDGLQFGEHNVPFLRVSRFLHLDL